MNLALDSGSLSSILRILSSLVEQHPSRTLWLCSIIYSLNFKICLYMIWSGIIWIGSSFGHPLKFLYLLHDAKKSSPPWTNILYKHETKTHDLLLNRRTYNSTDFSNYLSFCLWMQPSIPCDNGQCRLDSF